MDGNERMSDRGDAPDTEPPVASINDAPDETPDAMDGTPRVSSLRPVSRAFSMRRLLNVASLMVAGVLLLALAIHWLPTLLPKPAVTPYPQTTHAQQTLDASRSLVRGAGWKPRGPDWAEDIAFSADTSVGYACGHFPPEPVEFFGIYHVIENGWEMFPSSIEAPTNGSCRVAVSPSNSADVVLIVDQCLRCTGSSAPTSHVYRSYDGGATWNALTLPPAAFVGDIVWTGQSTLFLVAEVAKNAGTATLPTFTLLASRMGGPLTEIPARSLVGYDTSFGSMTLISSGVTLYASVNDTVRCSSSCTLHLQSSDEGRSWETQDFSNLAIRVINLEAAQPGGSTLFGWTFESAVGALFIQRSDDGGASWQALPRLPVNLSTGGATLFAAPNGAVYAFCYGQANAVYALGAHAAAWQTLAPLPGGTPLTVQYDAQGRAVALWGQALDASGPNAVAGLVYFPLPENAP
jgi:hypothetical protein